MTPLAEATYDILRQRVTEADPRITYAELAARLRELSDPAWFVRNLDAVFARLEKLDVDATEPEPSPGPTGEE